MSEYKLKFNGYNLQIMKLLYYIVCTLLIFVPNSYSNQNIFTIEPEYQKAKIDELKRETIKKKLKFSNEILTQLENLAQKKDATALLILFYYYSGFDYLGENYHNKLDSIKENILTLSKNSDMYGQCLEYTFYDDFHSDKINYKMIPRNTQKEIFAKSTNACIQFRRAYFQISNGCTSLIDNGNKEDIMYNLKQSAAQNFPEAFYYLMFFDNKAQISLDDRNNQEIDYNKALFWAMKAADAGIAEAYIYQGFIHYKKNNYKKAFVSFSVGMNKAFMLKPVALHYMKLFKSKLSDQDVADCQKQADFILRKKEVFSYSDLGFQIPLSPAVRALFQNSPDPMNQQKLLSILPHCLLF